LTTLVHTLRLKQRRRGPRSASARHRDRRGDRACDLRNTRKPNASNAVPSRSLREREGHEIGIGPAPGGDHDELSPRP
jgi:hypothetical protein